MRNSRAVSLNAEAAGGGQRRIFAERMSGDKGGVPSHRETGFLFKHAQGRERDRHQRRLGVFGELEGLRRTIPDDPGQFFAKRRIHLVEYRAGGRKSLGERLAHSDGLRPLPRKGKCCSHFCPEFNEVKS